MSCRLRHVFVAAPTILLMASVVSGQSLDPQSLDPTTTTATLVLASPPADQTAAPQVATEYSDAYKMRAKIHKVSSLATLPLFAAEGIIGQQLYSNPGDSGKKDAHLAVAAGIGALFAVNTVTGVWNLIEARKDPVRKKRRLVHGLLMLGADAGFLATAALGPDTEHGTVADRKATHRAVAFTSIGLATTGYLVMLFGNH